MSVIRWKTGSGGVYETALNWDGGLVPVTGDNVVPAAPTDGSGNSYTVTVSSAERAATLDITGENLTLVTASLSIAGNLTTTGGLQIDPYFATGGGSTLSVRPETC